MTTLKITPKGSDSSFPFTVKVAGSKVNRVCTLKQFGEKLEVTQGATVMQDFYSAEDDKLRATLFSMTPLQAGDMVEVEGKQYSLKVRGNFSDLGYLSLAA